MFRRWFLILPVVVVTFLLFQNWIIFKSLEWSINNSEFSHEVKWESIEREGATLILKRPRLGPSEDTLFEADKITLHWDFHPFSRRLDLAIELTHPKIDLTALQWDLMVPQSEGWLSWLKIHTALKVDQGAVKHSKGISKVDLNFKAFDDTALVLSVEEGESQFELFFELKEGEGEGRLKAREFSLPFFSEVKEALFPSLTDGNILKGVLNGSLAARFSPHLAPQIQGNLKLYEVEFENFAKEFYLSASVVESDLFSQTPLPKNLELPWFPALLGKITVQKGDQIIWGDDLNRQLAAEDYSLAFHFDTPHHIRLESEGIESFQNKKKPYRLQAEFDVKDLNNINLDLGYESDDKAGQKTSLKVKGDRLGDEVGVLALDVKNFGIPQFTLLENILKRAAPRFAAAEFKQGKVDAKMTLGLDHFNLASLSLREIALRNIMCASEEWGCDFGAQSVAGFIEMDFKDPTPGDTLEGELFVVKGFLDLKTVSGMMWNFADIETALVIKKGILQRSVAHASLAGLSGRAEIDWSAPKNPIKMEFLGKGSDLAPFMPARIRSGIERRSLDDEIRLGLVMNRETDVMRFKGELLLRDPHQGLLTTFAYGFDLISPSPENEGGFDDIFAWFEESDLSPKGSFDPIGDAGIFGYKLAGGWLRAKGLSLEKYLSSYLFKKDDIVLSGSADMEGAFDLKGMTLYYTAENLLLESGKLRMEMPYVLGKKEGDFLGVHHFDFILGEHKGELPIVKATYYDKVKGLFFDDVSGSALFHEKIVYLPDLEAFLNGVYLKGGVLVDNTDEREGFFDLYTHIQTLNGSLEALNRSLERIDPELIVVKAPLNGQVWLKEEGASFTLKMFQDEFYRDDFEWEGQITGSLTDGTLEVAPLGIEAVGVGLNFHYDKKEDLLKISDFGGTFFAGSQGSENELGFLIDHFTLSSLSAKEGGFSFTLYDKEGDLLALKGSLEPDDEGKVLIRLDSDFSHLLDDPFKRSEIMTVGFSRLSSARVEFLLPPTKLFSRLGLLTPEMKTHLNGVEGTFRTTLKYDEAESRLHFEMLGEGISVLGRPFERAQLEGEFHEGVFSIHNGVFDDYIFSVDLLKKEEEWVLRHLGLKIKEALLLGIEGGWKEGESQFKADLNHVEIVLDKLDGFPEMKPFIDEFAPKGRLKGTGTLRVSWEDKEPTLVAELETRSKNVIFNGLHFNDINGSALRFDLGKAVELKQVKSAILDPETGDKLLDFDVGNLAINFEKETLQVDSMAYDAEASALPKLASVLQSAFPDIFTPFVVDSLTHLKSEGRAIGTMGLDLNETAMTFKGTLADGKWHFLGWDSDLEQFQIEMDRDEVKLSTLYKLDDKSVWVLARTPRPQFDTGVVLIADGALSEEEPVTLHWTHNEGEGLVLKSVKGSALGLNFDLKEDEKNPTTQHMHRLKGDIGVDFSRVASLFDPETQGKIKTLGLAEGWGVRGNFELSKESSPSGRNYAFDGEVYGNDLVLYDHIFEKTYGRVHADPERMTIEEWVLEDLAGTLYVKEGWIEKSPEGIWNLEVPLVAGYDLRPSLLWEKGKKRAKDKKPLVVKTFQIQDLSGPLASPSELTGKGILSFVNPQKKNLQNTIFAIPSEILSRIGIDMVALTPVTGTVSFDIADEKVWFTKFKDVHSEGKLSKFYLADPKTPSYMDFSGDLHLQIRMKQYTLLFKLAELFTFTIEGTLAKPSYSLQKGGKP